MVEKIKEISKAEFIRRITKDKSLFLGISTAMGDKEIDVIRKMKLEEHKPEARICVARSNNHLVFNGESYLYLKDEKPHTLIKCYATDDNILAVEQKWLDIDWNGNIYGTRYKYLYYAMEA